MSGPPNEALRITAVIPVIDEVKALPATLDRLKECGIEAVVADGGSRDGTREAALNRGARLVTSPPGRARQMNAGAARVPDGVVLFLHADTLLPVDAPAHIRRALARPGAAGGAFRLNIRSGHPFLRVIARLANLRSILFGLPYGDQAIFLQKDLFDRIGGYADLPLMEDVDLADKIRAAGRMVICPAAVETSARRWEEEGMLKTSLANLLRLLRYKRGAPAWRLARGYGRVR